MKRRSHWNRSPVASCKLGGQIKVIDTWLGNLAPSKSAGAVLSFAIA
jgi:hypothetical protein